MPRTIGEAPQIDVDDNVELAGTPDVVENVEPPYNPALDPSSPQWNPKMYFKAQKKVMIFVHRDPSDMQRDPQGKVMVYKPFSINGYTLNIPTGVSVYVPKDFADYITELGMAVSQESEQIYRVE